MIRIGTNKIIILTKIFNIKYICCKLSLFYRHSIPFMRMRFSRSDEWLEFLITAHICALTRVRIRSMIQWTSVMAYSHWNKFNICTMYMLKNSKDSPRIWDRMIIQRTKNCKAGFRYRFACFGFLILDLNYIIVLK